MKNMKALNCLLIDDDAEDLEIFELAINQTGVPVQLHCAKSLEEALPALSLPDKSPDIVFLDVNMPRERAAECIRKIKSLLVSKNPQYVALSTHASERDIAELKALGASYLVKPSTIEHYEAQLLNILSSKMSVQNN
jgi:CheY-like chemotaxis protein